MAKEVAERSRVDLRSAKNVMAELLKVTDLDDAFSTVQESLGLDSRKPKSDPKTWLGACIKRRRGGTAHAAPAAGGRDPDDPRAY